MNKTNKMRFLLEEGLRELEGKRQSLQWYLDNIDSECALMSILDESGHQLALNELSPTEDLITQDTFEYDGCFYYIIEKREIPATGDNYTQLTAEELGRAIAEAFNNACKNDAITCPPESNT